MMASKNVQLLRSVSTFVNEAYFMYVSFLKFSALRI